MKKITAIIMLVAMIACFATAAAYAETAEETVKELATKHEKVLDAECIVYERICLVAIKTEKFTTKSEYEKYVAELTEQIKQNCEVDVVHVSRSPKLMNKLAELNKLDEAERGKAVEQIINKIIEHRDHGHKLPPKLLDVR